MINKITYIIIFFYGMTLGSFYNVVGLRTPLNKSIIKPRSHCSKCEHILTPIELIPVLSYVLLKGKCRHCQVSISSLYPTMEVITGILFMVGPLIMGWTYELIIAWTLISLCTIIIVSDLTYMIIPDKVLIVFAVIFVIERFVFPLDPWWDSMLGAVTGFILLLLITLISKGGMGGGDIKLFAVLGLLLGIKVVLLAFFLSTFLGALIGMIGILFGKLEKKKPIPFGPFICVGTLLAYFFGEQIIKWYFYLIF